MDRRPERHDAPHARLFFGVITGFERLFDAVRERIAARFGPLEPGDESPVFPFPATRTYAPTMGAGPLLRKFLFLRDPWPQEALAAVKRGAIAIEEDVARAERVPVSRPVNIDPGILNDCRVVLASTKDHAHRIYRGDGIWEELTLVFHRGRFEPLPWTYPDFRNPDYAEYFARIRARHLQWLARGAGGGRPAGE